MRPNRVQKKQVTFANPPTAVQETPVSGATKGFNFVKVKQHIDSKLPRYTGKTLRVNPRTGQFTRKKFRLEGLIPKRNPSGPWVADAKAKAGVMKGAFNGANFLAACEYLETAKVPDTKEAHVHVTVLAQTQKRFEALQAWQQRRAEVQKAQDRLEAAKQRVAAMQVEVHDGAQENLNNMAEKREEDRAALSRAGSLPHQVAAAETAKRLKDAVMTVRPQKQSKRVMMQAARKPASRNLHQDMAEKKQEKKKPALRLDHAALSQWVFAEAQRLDMNPLVLIDHLLLDMPVGAYLNDEQFGALRALYGQLGDQHLKEEGLRQLAPLQAELNQRIGENNAAVRAYRKLPDPG